MKIKSIKKEKSKFSKIEIDNTISKSNLSEFLIKFTSNIILNQNLTNQEFNVLKLMIKNKDNINSTFFVNDIMKELKISKRKTVYELRKKLIDKNMLIKENSIFKLPTILDESNYDNFEITIKTNIN